MTHKIGQYKERHTHTDGRTDIERIKQSISRLVRSLVPLEISFCARSFRFVSCRENANTNHEAIHSVFVLTTRTERSDDDGFARDLCS